MGGGSAGDSVDGVLEEAVVLLAPEGVGCIDKGNGRQEMHYEGCLPCVSISELKYAALSLTSHATQPAL